MSSPLKSHGVNSSFSEKQTDESVLDDSCLSTSYEVNIVPSEQRNIESAIDRGIAALKDLVKFYEDKACHYEHQLEQLGVSVKDFPEDLKSDLWEAFKDDNGVFSFPQASRELVRINPDHVLDSLQEKCELEQLQMLNSQLATLVEQYSCQQDNLQRKLNAEKLESNELDSLRFDKEVNLTLFKDKLEGAMLELKNLQQLSQNNKKPKYNLDDLENLKQEKTKLENDIAFLNTKLKKYNGLSLNEKDAQKQLEKMKEDLKKVDNEMRQKVAVS